MKYTKTKWVLENCEQLARWDHSKNVVDFNPNIGYRINRTASRNGRDPGKLRNRKDRTVVPFVGRLKMMKSGLFNLP